MTRWIEVVRHEWRDEQSTACFFFCSSAALDPILRSAKIKFWLRLPWRSLAQLASATTSASVTPAAYKLMVQMLHPGVQPQHMLQLLQHSRTPAWFCSPSKTSAVVTSAQSSPNPTTHIFLHISSIYDS